MFIEREQQPSVAVWRSGAQVDGNPSGSFRSSKQRRVSVARQLYKYRTPNGVKPRLNAESRLSILEFGKGIWPRCETTKFRVSTGRSTNLLARS
jgi:hypothetical protein